MSINSWIDPADIDTIRKHLAGKRLASFLESIDVLRESLEQGGWVSRGAQRAGKGFSQGIASNVNEIHTHRDASRRNALFGCYMSARFGSHLIQSDFDIITDEDITKIVPKVPVEATRAWLRLMVSLRAIYEDLNASRPAPVYTEIGLSPKVTKTLQDANLDLDLTTRRLCPLGWRWIDMRDKHGNVVTRNDGTIAQVKLYFPEWPAGTVFGSSRFSECDCEACGKTIPSKMFVPVIVADRSGVVHGFWFGRDCARNILGLRDAGIKRDV